MNRLLFEHIIRNLILELLERSAVGQAVRDLAKTGKVRVGNRVNRVYAPDMSDEDFKKLIQQTLGISDVNVIRSGEPGSGSSQFSTFEFRSKDGKEKLKVVLAKGIIAGEEGEKKQESSIAGQIKELGTINLHTQIKGDKAHPDGVFRDIDGFVRITGNKKADFAFTVGGKPVLYLQHKGETHQQMSGIKELEKKADIEGKKKYPEIEEFVKEVKAKVEASPDRKLESPVSKSISDEDLKKEAVYGSQDGTSNGVQIYAVGDLKLEGTGKDKTLSASRIYYYDKIPTGADEPYLGAKYVSDRSQYGVFNTRFGVYPKSYFKGS